MIMITLLKFLKYFPLLNSRPVHISIATQPFKQTNKQCKYGQRMYTKPSTYKPNTFIPFPHSQQLLVVFIASLRTLTFNLRNSIFLKETPHHRNRSYVSTMSAKSLGTLAMIYATDDLQCFFTLPP